MKLEKITGEHIEVIGRLYQEYVGHPDHVRSMYELFWGEPDDIAAKWRKEVSEDYRLGSRWDPHSKLYLETQWGGDVKVRFGPNFTPADRNTPQHEEALEAGRQFEAAVLRYFASLEQPTAHDEEIR